MEPTGVEAEVHREVVREFRMEPEVQNVHGVWRVSVVLSRAGTRQEALEMARGALAMRSLSATHALQGPAPPAWGPGPSRKGR